MDGTRNWDPELDPSRSHVHIPIIQNAQPSTHPMTATPDSHEIKHRRQDGFTAPAPPRVPQPTGRDLPHPAASGMAPLPTSGRVIGVAGQGAGYFGNVSILKARHL